MRQSRQQRLYQAVEQQKQWIADHGGDLMGYIAKYGSAGDPPTFVEGVGYVKSYYGEGGEAVYQADYNELVKLQKQLVQNLTRHRRQHA